MKKINEKVLMHLKMHIQKQYFIQSRSIFFLQKRLKPSPHSFLK